jgi:hypothetical protein
VFGFGKKFAPVTAERLPAIVAEVHRRLEANRELFLLGVMSSFKEEGLPIPGVSGALHVGGSLDSALRAFQLTCVVGFMCREYLNRTLFAAFCDELTHRMDNGEPLEINRFRDRYLDAGGDVARLTHALATDVYELWGRPQPQQEIVNGLAMAAQALAIVSQSGVAAAVGDRKTEQFMRKLAAGG